MQNSIIQQTHRFVKETLKNAESGHDWWHIHRVNKLSMHLASFYKETNILIIELGSLLHDIADSKFHHGDENIGPQLASEFLTSLHIDENTEEHVLDIIRNISFKNSDQCNFNSLEFQLIQDADRLDAIGAIGIARAFSYGGYKNREMYNPEIKPQLNMTSEEYKKTAGPTINHFYEKLLLLKDKLNTPEAKNIAEKRHQFMLSYLDQFYAEWDYPSD